MRMPLSRVIRSFVVAPLAAVVISCANHTLAPSEVQLQLRNVSSDSIAFRAIDRELSNRVDPYPGPIAVASFGAQVAAPGATVTVAGTTIDGFQAGADVRLFLYSVRAGQATFTRTFDIAGGQVNTRDNRIDLPRLDSAQ